jgi:hypothetical protein
MRVQNQVHRPDSTISRTNSTSIALSVALAATAIAVGVALRNWKAGLGLGLGAVALGASDCWANRQIAHGPAPCAIVSDDPTSVCLHGNVAIADVRRLCDTRPDLQRLTINQGTVPMDPRTLARTMSSLGHLRQLYLYRQPIDIVTLAPSTPHIHTFYVRFRNHLEQGGYSHNGGIALRHWHIKYIHCRVGEFTQPWPYPTTAFSAAD